MQKTGKDNIWTKLKKIHNNFKKNIFFSKRDNNTAHFSVH